MKRWPQIIIYLGDCSAGTVHVDNVCVTDIIVFNQRGEFFSFRKKGNSRDQDSGSSPITIAIECEA